MGMIRKVPLGFVTVVRGGGIVVVCDQMFRLCSPCYCNCDHLACLPA